MRGFVLLYRKILNNPIFLKAELLQLFIYCLLKANHRDNEFIFNDKLQIVKRGSFITGRFQLSKELKQSESSVYRRLKILQKLNYISLKVNNRFTTVTIVKYNTYQDVNLKANNKRTTREQQENINNNDITINKEKNYLNFVVKLYGLITNKITEQSYCYSIVNQLLKYKENDKISYLQRCLMLMFVIRRNQDRVTENKFVGILINQFRNFCYEDFKKNVFEKSINENNYDNEYAALN